MHSNVVLSASLCFLCARISSVFSNFRQGVSLNLPTKVFHLVSIPPLLELRRDGFLSNASTAKHARNYCLGSQPRLTTGQSHIYLIGLWRLQFCKRFVLIDECVKMRRGISFLFKPSALYFVNHSRHLALLQHKCPLIYLYKY